MTRAASRPRALVLVAHPDDETLFFGGLIASSRDVEFHVVCATDGGHDGRAAARRAEFPAACGRLGAASARMLGFADAPGRRLDVDALTGAFAALGAFDAVYTHGALGDYGHPHHQDVSRAAHRAFGEDVWSVATNVAPARVVALDEVAYATKLGVMTEVYGQELGRLLLVLPVGAAEGFVRVGEAESAALYGLLAHGTPVPAGAVTAHRAVLPFVEAGAVERSARGFFAAYLAA